MNPILEFLNGQPRMRILLLGCLAVSFLGALDYFTGYELSFSIFYMLPVAVVAWYVNRRAGILISCASAASWLLAESLAGSSYSHPVILLWNTLVRLGLFLIVTYVLSTLRIARQSQENLTNFVVHDLRSPLSVILAGLQLLEEIGADLPEKDRQLVVQNGIAAGNRMLTLINSLLDLSKLESGRIPVRVEDVDVRDLVKQSLEHVELWAKHKRLGLVAQFDTQVEAVQADPDLTLRVLVNLLDNAIKFSPPESTITVRVAAVQDGILAFSVIDQGPGIPEEWRDRIFDKFVSVEARTRGVAVGSGLGLHFCRQAVKAQGGQIWLENGQAGSTTFHFTLPTAGCHLGDRYSRKRQTRHKPPSNNLAVLLPERPHRYTHFGQES